MGIDVERVLNKLDEYLLKKDFSAAERHLRYWLSETEMTGDLRGKLTLTNEQIGLYRMLGNKDQGLEAVEAALALTEALELDGTVSLATTLLNAATAYKAFGMAESAVPLFEMCRQVYEAALPENDGRLGGLYNNMALNEMDLGNWQRAEALFRKALEVMSRVPEGAGNMAVTYCNLADLATLTQGAEAGKTAAAEYLEAAMKLLDSPALPRNGAYAFVCEKCAPCFGSHGFVLQENELKKRAAELSRG